MKGNFQDSSLVSASILGDEEAFGELYDKYVNQIYRFILVRVGNTHEAEDLSSEVFLKTWEYISNTERTIENFKALIYRISRNIVIDHYRKKHKESITIDGDAWEGVVDTSESLERVSEIQDDVRIVLHTINKLPEQHREIIILRYIDELSVKEIASILNKKSGATRVALHRAIKILKQILHDSNSIT